jgi:hypothetical protein
METLDYLHEANQKALGTRKVVEKILGKKKKPNSTISTSPASESEIFKALLNLSEPLAKSYIQVKIDLEDNNRSSWAGTAHEIREVLANLLRILAPDEKVTLQKWYHQEEKISGPTQKQRVRYILQENGAGSKEKEVVELATQLEEMTGNIVRATYSRASDAAHRFKTRKEVTRIVKYFDAFANDLLDLE